MTTVPALVLPLVRPDWTPEQAGAVSSRCGVRLGQRVELRTGLLDQAQPGLGTQAAAYWNACRDFWDQVAQGREGSGMLIRRQLLQARQSDRAGERSDLSEQLAELLTTGMSPIVEEATGPVPQWGDVDRMLGPHDVRDSQGTQTALTLRVSGRQPWADGLGGPHSRGELTREFAIGVNHAPWRDRRVRRLAFVTVNAIELWADPTPYQDPGRAH